MSTLSDIVRNRIAEMKSAVVSREEVLNGWNCKNAKFVDTGKYEFAGEPRPIDVGDVWAK